MATTLGPAKIKVTLDTKGAKDELNRIQNDLTKVDDKRTEGKRDREQDDRDDERKKKESAAKASKQVAKFGFKSLSVIGIMSSLPFGLGTAFKFGKAFSEFGPAAADLKERLLQSLDESGESGVLSAIQKKSIETAIDAAVSGSDMIKRLEILENSFRSAFSQTVQIAKLQSVAGGVDPKFLLEAFDVFQTVNEIQGQLQKQMREAGIVAGGRVLQDVVVDQMTNLWKGQ